jgi:hypothetical protein
VVCVVGCVVAGKSHVVVRSQVVDEIICKTRANRKHVKARAAVTRDNQVRPHLLPSL